MMRQSRKTAVLFGVLAGAYLAVSFVNPYGDETALSEVILQLSGSRGALIMGCSLPELVGYMLRMMPNYIVIMIWGIELYRQFCTASIYVFSRCASRGKWYAKTLVRMLGSVCIYETVLVGTVILITALRFRIHFPVEDFRILGAHLVIYLLWNLTWILLMNFLSIRFGSSTAAAMVIGVQAVCTAALTAAGFLEEEQILAQIAEKLLQCNPVTYTILGWQCEGGWGFLNIRTSILLLCICCILVMFAGGFWICRMDLITENMETETV